MIRHLGLTLAAAAVLLGEPLFAIKPETLQAVSAIPAHLAGRFREAIGFEQSEDGQYFVFDRRAHTVYGIDEQQTSVWEIVQIGAEPGRILDPTAFDVAPDGTFVVADAPNGRERIQIFSRVGFRSGGFMMPGRGAPRITLGNVVLNGIGTLRYTGTSIVMSLPETGALIAEYTLQGGIKRSIGTLRPTGHESEPDLHVALNSGFALPDNAGGFFFVFQSGEPIIQRYDSEGHLLFERHVQGREIDPLIAELPTVWPRRRTAEGELPVVTPTVRAAAVDRSGNLWIAFVRPYVYVYDPDGDKIRSLQLQAAGVIAPASLFFGPHGRLLATPGLVEFRAP
ncbi:MAG TPA: hypothetical protein VH583_15765 [Vicinamibacterales bacterium]